MKSTPDNIFPPKAGEPIRASFLQALTDRGKSVSFPRGVVAGGARAQSAEPKTCDYAKIRIQNKTEGELEVGSALQLDGVLTDATTPEDFIRLNPPNRRVFGGIVATMDNPNFALIQSKVPPNGFCSAMIAGYSIARIHSNSQTHDFATLPTGATTLESGDSGPVRILSRSESGDDDIFIGIVRFESGVPHLIAKNLTDEFDSLNDTDSAAMQPAGTTDAESQVEVFSERYGTDLPPFEFGWKLPSGAICQIENSKVHRCFIPELSGTLAASTVCGSDTESTINLSDGSTFDGETTISAFPAPNIPDGMSLETGTPVVARWNSAKGCWFFFVVRSGGASSELSVSGTALAGLGLHSDGIGIWACQLAAGSDPVGWQEITAIRETTAAIGSDDSTPWIAFPTNMTGGDSGTWVSHVRRNLFRDFVSGKIFRKEDYGQVLTDGTTDYRPTFQTFHGQNVWKSEAGNYVYRDGLLASSAGRWMISAALGALHDESNPGAETLAGLGLSEKVKPCWECDSTYGIYVPRSGTGAAGELLFGVPSFTVPLNADFHETGGTFLRSLKKEPQSAPETSRHWQYSGTFTFQTADGTTLCYSGLTFQTVGTQSGWVLGTLQDPVCGWFESDGEPDSETARSLTFRVVEKPDKTFTPASFLQGSFSDPILETETGFQIRDTDVACWTLSSQETAGVSFTFTFTQPDDVEPADPVPENPTVTLDDILRNAPTLPEIHFSEARSSFYLGTPDDPSGWFEASVSDFETVFTLTHGPIPRPDIPLTFTAWTAGAFTEPVWKVEPGITT